MLNRIVLAIIFLASLSWIIYVAIDISSEKNNYSPESLFNSMDGEVLIVARPWEVNFIDLEKIFYPKSKYGTIMYSMLYKSIRVDSN